MERGVLWPISQSDIPLKTVQEFDIRFRSRSALGVLLWATLEACLASFMLIIFIKAPKLADQ